jgi:ubiquinone/menaquinone biosynthesis C-methylase UbiE
MIEFGKTAADYARYRVPFSPELFTRLGRFGIGIAGQKVLDVGAGTGLLGDSLCQRGCGVTLLDVSVELLAASSLYPVLRGEGGGEGSNAFARNAAASNREVLDPSPLPFHLAIPANKNRSTGKREFIVARAEQLPFSDHSFDLVTAAQCWHWFDRQTAPREMLRVLIPGGYVAVVYQTYIPLPGSIAERTEHLILRHRPGWRHANSTGINGQVLRDLQINGLVEIESFSFDISIDFTHESWRGYIRTTSAVGASMNPQQLARFDGEHQSLLQQFSEPFPIPHRVFAAVARKPAVRL